MYLFQVIKSLSQIGRSHADALAAPHGLERSHRYFCYVCGTLLPHQLQTNDSLVCRRCKTPTFIRWFAGMEVSFSSQTTSTLTGGGAAVGEDTECSSAYFKSMLKRAKRILQSEAALKEALDSDMNGVGGNNIVFDGPTVRKECAYCGNDRMTYVTLQTRSADEGQTVIYTCTQCSKKEVENT